MKFMILTAISRHPYGVGSYAEISQEIYINVERISRIAEGWLTNPGIDDKKGTWIQFYDDSEPVFVELSPFSLLARMGAAIL